MRMRVLAIETDYGTADGRAAKLAGTIKRVDPSLEVDFANHRCPRGNIQVAGTLLYNSLPFFPAGTVYLCLVARAAGGNPPCAARTYDGKIILAPDNGLLTMWLENFGLESIRRLDLQSAPGDMDPYAYFAARLANGTMDEQDLGPVYPVEQAVRLILPGVEVREGYASCGVLSVMENFGNINLSLPIVRMEQTGIQLGQTVRVRMTLGEKTCFDEPVLYDRSFGYTALGSPILFNGSTGYVGLGLNRESFTQAYMQERQKLPEGVGAYRITIENIPVRKDTAAL